MAADKHVRQVSACTDGAAQRPRQIGSVTKTLCRIKIAVGEVEPCPEGACPFWVHGGAVVGAGCGIERLQIDVTRPDLAGYLARLRTQLEAARDAEERRAARQAFAALVPPEFSGR